MKIVLLAEELDLGGVSRHIVDLANGLEDSKIDVTVVAPAGPLHVALKPSIRFVPIERREKGSRRDVLWTRSALQVLRDVLTGKKAILHSHKRMSDIVARIASYSTKAIHISTCHNWFDDYPWTSCFGHWTVGISERISEQLIRRYHKRPERVITILHGIPDVEHQEEIDREKTRLMLRVRPDHSIVASIGHFELAKDRDLLLRSIAEYRAELERRNAVIVLAGEGSEKAEMELRVKQEHLGPVVRIISGNFDMTSLWNISKLGVLSSRQEGLPYVILEAASLGIPHVATNVGGVADFIENDVTGKLVQWNDPHALGAAMLEFLDNDDLRRNCGENARQRQIARHGYDQFMNRMIAFYTEVASS